MSDLQNFEENLENIRNLSPNNSISKFNESFEFHVPRESDLEKRVQSEIARRICCEEKILELQEKDKNYVRCQKYNFFASIFLENYLKKHLFNF